MKTFICKNCQGRFTGTDVASKNGGRSFECPKCGKRNAELFEEKGIEKKEWKPLGSFIRDESK